MGLRILPVFAIELHIRDLEVLKKNKGIFWCRVRNGKNTKW
jgi:hypothetical protein